MICKTQGQEETRRRTMKWLETRHDYCTEIILNVLWEDENEQRHKKRSLKCATGFDSQSSVFQWIPQVCFDAGLWLVLWWMKRPYLKQPSQSMFPVVSLMVRSEKKAGYSVSHGTILVLPWGLWAERGRNCSFSITVYLEPHTLTHTHTHTHTHSQGCSSLTFHWQTDVPPAVEVELQQKSANQQHTVWYQIIYTYICIGILRIIAGWVVVAYMMTSVKIHLTTEKGWKRNKESYYVHYVHISVRFCEGVIVLSTIVTAKNQRGWQQNVHKLYSCIFTCGFLCLLSEHTRRLSYWPDKVHTHI